MTLVTVPLPPAPSSAMPASVMPGLRTPSYKLFTRKELCNMTDGGTGGLGGLVSIVSKVYVTMTRMCLTLR